MYIYTSLEALDHTVTVATKRKKTFRCDAHIVIIVTNPPVMFRRWFDGLANKTINKTISLY